MSEKRMDINHDNAMALWSKRYGKATRVKDFSGREMDKGSYDNRNSQYGWNLDHINPKSNGGKDTESNLICVNIETNDEKADKFPVFVANGKTFEIIKVENHYEIRGKKPVDNSNDTETEDKGINFFDHSAALKSFKTWRKNGYFIGSIYIELTDVVDNAVLFFIREVLANNDYDFHLEKDPWSQSMGVFSIIDDVKTKEITSNILEACVLINTYLRHYFQAHQYIGKYVIYAKLQKFDYPTDIDYSSCKDNYVSSDANMLLINSNLRINTEAKEKANERYSYSDDIWQYDFSYINLRENLGKVSK